LILKNFGAKKFESDNFLQQWYPSIHHLNRDQNLIGGQMAV